MSSYKKKNYIGEQLNKAIKEKGITITQFAKEIGLSRALISKYINNTKHPSDATLQRIANYFNLPPEYFFDDVHLDKEGKIKRSFDIRNNKTDRYDSNRPRDVDAFRAMKLNMQLLNELFETLESNQKIIFAIEFTNCTDDLIKRFRNK